MSGSTAGHLCVRLSGPVWNAASNFTKVLSVGGNFASRLRRAASIAYALVYSPAVLPDKDCPIYRAAHGCRATHLLTGDIRDFGTLMNQPNKTDGLVIQTVAQFLETL